MIDLEKISGLPIGLKDNFRLKFNRPLMDREPSFIRTVEEMKQVLMDPNAKTSRTEAYCVYRDLHLPEDKDTVKDNHLSYDVTIIPNMVFGNEFNKTIGHYHANIPGKEISHPELYEILNGRALVLWQKIDHQGKVLAFLTLEVKAGDKVIYPPNYGHILVNIGNEPLVTANWISTDYKPLYEPIAEKRGMAYYAVKNSIGYELMPNKEYGDVPQPRPVNRDFMKRFPIVNDKPMYLTGMADPKKLDFLGHPDDYAVEMSSVSS